MGPLEAVKPWKSDGIVGTHRFVARVWRLLIDQKGAAIHTGDKVSEGFDKLLHKAIKKVTEDTEQMRFNTAISTMMELTNAAYKEPTLSRKAAETMILLVSPYAPHMAEELWSLYGHKATLAYEPWPKFDPAKTIDDTVTISIQVNGKLRGTLEVSKNAEKSAVIAEAKALETVQKQLGGKEPTKEIYVPGKIVNFVVPG